MTPFFNLASLLLGLTAWGLGIVKILRRKQTAFLMSASYLCMGTAMVLQFFELRHRILTGDLSAVLDIYPAMAWVTLVLLLGTVLLNVIALFRR